MAVEKNVGLIGWAKRHKTKTIAGSLEDKGVEDPKAIAVWLRKRALGEEEFRRHQQEARKKR